jgi:3-oxoacyl-[acyl-carrier protein] reductase
METGLKDRVVIVAASSQGLGRAIAEAFAAEGAKLAMCSRNAEKVRAAAESIRHQYKVETMAEAVDVAHADAIGVFVQAVAERFGRIDVCVTNAGGPPAGGFSKVSAEDWQRAVQLNLLSVVHFAREVIPHMQRNRWGRIITLTSVSVKQPIPDLVLSNAVRTGVTGLVRSLANEYGRDGILVNNVGPGFTATERLQELAAARAKAGDVSEQQIFDGWAASTAIGRVAQPREVADAVLFLASERASAITGQTLLVDGGSYKGL